MSTEREPQIHLNLRGETVIATRENASLFMFLGDLAAYNHIFIAMDDSEEGRTLGNYIFSSSESYEPIMSFMAENAFPMHVNLLEVADCDVGAFDRHHYRDIRQTNTIPEDWQ